MNGARRLLPPALLVLALLALWQLAADSGFLADVLEVRNEEVLEVDSSLSAEGATLTVLEAL